jgi:hypothetical protein
VPGPTGPTGATGPTGPQGESGTAGGLVYYFDTAGGSFTGTPIDGTILVSPTTSTQTTITGSVSVGETQVASFFMGAGALQQLIIDPGFFLFHTWGQAGSTDLHHYYKVYHVDSDGVSNKTLIASGSTNNAIPLTTDNTMNSYSMYIPQYTYPDLTKRVLVELWLWAETTTNTFTLRFRDGTLTHVHTTEVPIGPTGPTGSTGPTGPYGSFAYSTLPVSANSGDAWFDPETGKAFIYYDNYWVEVGAAPAGPTGPTGVAGVTGPTGPQGLQGPTGPAGTGTAGSADLATTWWLGF